MKVVIWGRSAGVPNLSPRRLSCTHLHKPLSVCLETPTPDPSPHGGGERAAVCADAWIHKWIGFCRRSSEYDWVQHSLRMLTRAPPPCGVETSEARLLVGGGGQRALNLAQSPADTPVIRISTPVCSSDTSATTAAPAPASCLP